MKKYKHKILSINNLYKGHIKMICNNNKTNVE